MANKYTKAIDSAQELIDLTAQKVELLKEWKEALIYESCIYDLKKPGIEPYYLLYNIETKEQVFAGKLDRLQSYIRLRNIDIELIYNHKILFNGLPKKNQVNK